MIYYNCKKERESKDKRKEVKEMMDYYNIQGMTIEEAITTLKNNGVKYEYEPETNTQIGTIEYDIEVYEIEDGKVLYNVDD